jgi:ATP-dependent DNA ligase
LLVFLRERNPGAKCFCYRIATICKRDFRRGLIPVDLATLLVRKTTSGIRIYTRRGADWTKRFPAIVDAGNKIKAASFYLDGEGVVCDADGIAMFDKLHSKANDHAVFLYAFDLLEIDGGCVVSKRRDLPYRSGRVKSWLKIKNPKSPAAAIF